MEIYYIILFLFLITAFIKSSKKQVILNSIILITILSVRKFTVGADLLTYISIFKNISKINILKYDMEKGYLLFNKVANIFTNNERIYLIIVSILIIGMLSNYIYKNSKMIWLSFFLLVTLGYYEMSFNILRQILAMGIMLYSIDSIKERNIKKFLLIYIVGLNFHYTAGIFLILYIIYPLKINIYYNFILILGILSNIIFGKEILNFILKILPKYYSRYGDKITSGEGKIYFVFLLGVYVVGLIFIKNKEKLRIEYHMLALAILLQSISINFSLFVRTVQYFAISMIILIPNIIKKQKDIKIRYMGIICIILVTFFYFQINLDRNLSRIIPYLFYWE